MAMKVVSVKTEKVLDTNPNIYLERAEEMLKKEQFDEALKASKLAVEYSNYNERYILQSNKIKNAIVERYLSVANKYISCKNFSKAIEQCNKIKIIKDISYDYISKADEIIKRANNIIEKMKTADAHLNNANLMIRNGKYNEAVNEAKKALTYMNTYEYILKVDNIKKTANDRLNEIEANRHIETARNLLVQEKYNEAVQEVNNAIQIYKGTSITNSGRAIRFTIANKFMGLADDSFQNQMFSKSLEQAQLAVGYSDNDLKYIKIFENLKDNIRIKKIEIKANKHIETARNLLMQKKYNEGIQEVNNAMQISKNASIINIGKIIKITVADKFMVLAEESFQNQMFSKSLEQGQLAVDYSDNLDQYIERFENLKESIRIKKLEIKADSYMENAKEFMNNKDYYNTLEEANKALKCSYGTELSNKYFDIYNKIESYIKDVDKEDIVTLGDKYYEVSNFEQAIEWYGIANNGKSLYKIGKIEFFDKLNIDFGVDYLERAANLGYEKAFIELMNLFTEGKYVKRKLKRVKNYYKEFKHINRKLAKQTLKNLKQKYNLSLRKRLIITGRIKLVRYIILFFVIFVLSYSSIMFYDGNWSGYIKDVSFSVNNNTLAINEEEKCTVSYKVIPFFANNKLYKIVPENSSIIDVKGDNFKGLVEGKTNLIVYINDKEYKREEITVYKPRVIDFDISFNENSTLNKVGDFIIPKLNIKYFNDKKVDNVEPIFISNNQKVVRVEGSVLIASGIGNATVTIKVGGIKKELNFNIQKDYNNKIYDNSYIFKYIDKVYLPLDYLKNTDRNTLIFLVYEIYARHGQIFKEEPYKSYFESKSWYKGTKQAITEDMVNDFEKTNIRLIKERLRDNY